MRPDERAFLERARVAALATVDEAGRPHAVPICFAILESADQSDSSDATESQRGSRDDSHGVRLVSAIDEKPKATRELRRVRNIRANPRVTLLADRYRKDWARLAWVQVRGRARILEPSASDIDSDGVEPAVHDAAVNALEDKYDQYATHDLGDRPVVVIGVDRTVSWGALEEKDREDGT